MANILTKVLAEIGILLQRFPIANRIQILAHLVCNINIFNLVVFLPVEESVVAFWVID